MGRRCKHLGCTVAHEIEGSIINNKVSKKERMNERIHTSNIEMEKSHHYHYHQHHHIHHPNHHHPIHQELIDSQATSTMNHHQVAPHVIQENE